MNCIATIKTFLVKRGILPTKSKLTYNFMKKERYDSTGHSGEHSAIIRDTRHDLIGQCQHSCDEMVKLVGRFPSKVM